MKIICTVVHINAVIKIVIIMAQIEACNYKQYFALRPRVSESKNLELNDNIVNRLKMQMTFTSLNLLATSVLRQT